MPVQNVNDDDKFPSELDSGVAAHGILEVMPDGYGFIRCANYLPGENDVYVAPSQIRRFNLKTGDIVEGNTRIKTQNEKFSALLYVKSINGYSPDVAARRCNFEDMTPIFPEERVRLELSRSSTAMRIMDLMSPVGKGQRGMIVSPPKAGKTTLLKQVAQSVKVNNPDMHLIILLIDERPEEVTDFREAIEGPNVEVIYSTFDELPEHHKRVSEMVIERAKRLVEHKKDVMILLDSITRLTRAYNLSLIHISFPRSDLPEGFSFSMDFLGEAGKAALPDSARNADMPYEEGVTYTVTLDGFIISDNIELKEYENIHTGYLYADHDPVRMVFSLK